MNKRDLLREAIREYLITYWKITPGDDELERYLAGTMAFIAVEAWEHPFTPFYPMPIIEEKEEEVEV